MLGKVREECSRSSAGRLVDLNNTNHNFSLAAAGGAKLNSWVKFDPTSRGNNNLLAFQLVPAPREGGGELIRKIAKTWKSKAQDDLLPQGAVDRYYIRNRIIEPIEDGDVSLVLGRKGSGKTAIVKHFESKAKGRWNRYVVPIEFSRDISPAINQLLANLPERSVDVFRTFWNNIIWITVADHIIKSGDEKFISDGYKTKLKDALGGNPASSSMKAVGSLALNATLLYFGFPAIQTQNQDLASAAPQKIDLIPEVVYGVLTEGASIHVFVDELDREFAGDKTGLIKSDIIKGLIEASTDIRRMSALYPLKVIPIVLLRDDVYHMLPPSSDKHSWFDSSVQLEWTDEDLREMVGYRIFKERVLLRGGRLTQEDMKEVGDYFDSNWLRVFEENVSDGVANHKDKPDGEEKIVTDEDVLRSGEYYQQSALQSRSIIREIISSSFRTPREMLVFISHAARCYIENQCRGAHINHIDFKKSKLSSLQIIKEQVRSEVHDDIPEIDDVLTVIKMLPAQDIRYGEWCSLIKASLGQLCDVNNLTNRMFQFSLVGYKRGRLRVFSYLDSTGIPFSENLKIIIHSGLYASCKPGS